MKNWVRLNIRNSDKIAIPSLKYIVFIKRGTSNSLCITLCRRKFLGQRFNIRSNFRGAFFLSGFSFMNADDSRNSWGKGRLFL